MIARMLMLISAAVVAAVVASCAGTGSSLTRAATVPAQVSAPAQSSSVSSGAHRAVMLAYDLLTHCGIDEARVGSTYFEADHPLSDGSGNPPPGWDNPYQQGTMTLLSPDVALFDDRAGHQVRFHARAGATSFRRLCA